MCDKGRSGARANRQHVDAAARRVDSKDESVAWRVGNKPSRPQQVSRYAPRNENFVLVVFVIIISAFVADCGEESVEIAGEPLIEAVEWTTFVRGEVAIAGERLEETGGEWSIDALE